MMILAEDAEGRRTNRWDKKAIFWYQRAARNGDIAARRRLAIAYQEGQLGLPKDPDQAKVWHDLWQESEAKEKMFRSLPTPRSTAVVRDSVVPPPAKK